MALRARVGFRFIDVVTVRIGVRVRVSVRVNPRLRIRCFALTGHTCGQDYIRVRVGACCRVRVRVGVRGQTSITVTNSLLGDHLFHPLTLFILHSARHHHPLLRLC